MRIILALAISLALAAAADAAVEVKIDPSAARAVLAAVQNPALTRDQALAIAHLPGNEGLIRKEHAYGRNAADEAQLADALLAAAHHAPAPDNDRYRFAQVRDNAAAITATLDALTDPKKHALEDVKARLALFTPPRVKGTATGYLVAGGPSGGFAFGEPDFYLNLTIFPYPPLAKTILAHELYHAVRGLAEGARKSAPERDACLAGLPHGKDLDSLFGDLSNEGIATFVGDVLALPDSADRFATDQRNHLKTNVNRVHRSVTVLDLSVHALTTGSKLSYEGDIYPLGFYDDEILYALGYVMTKAIATERGPAAVAELIDRPGSAFITAYAGLKGYGVDQVMPRLDSETLEWAGKVNACSVPGRG